MLDYNLVSGGGLQASTAKAVGMQPLVMDGVFGWYHSNSTLASNDVAILLCGALSREALDSHHSLRVLADDFAAAGYPTMRFDYLETGDSCDIPRTAEEPGEHWAAWLRNVHDAADHLRRCSGAQRLILCGLRLGATLAALAAECREDVAGLILLAPVLRGRSYLRQLQIEAELAHGKPTSKVTGFEFHELRLRPETVGLIGDVDLRRVKLAAGLKVAIFSQSPSRPLSESVSAWSALGVAVDSYAFDGLEPLLCPDTQGYKEAASSAQMIDWMNTAIAPQIRPAFSDLDKNWMGLRPPGCIETPLRFGLDERLVGIVCRPDGEANGTAVIIVNTGRNPRAGVGRFGVEFARRLAATGITSLRFDFAGLGDSIGPAGEEDMRSDVFETERLADISGAIDTLENLGCRRFIIQGICSGAYHALHAAVKDARIEAVLMANLPLFLWNAGDSITESKKRSYALSHYKTRLMGFQHWRRLLRGESDIRGIIKGQLLRLAKLFRLPGQNRNGGAGAQNQAVFARKLMAELSQRRTRTIFLFDPDHSGAYEIQSMFGKGGVGLKLFTGAKVQMIPGLGEAVGEAGARKIAADIMIEFITTS